MQTELFKGRESAGAVSVRGEGFSFFASTTWMFREAMMWDFMVRAACPWVEYSHPKQQGFPTERFSAGDMSWRDIHGWCDIHDDLGQVHQLGARGNSCEILCSEVVHFAQLWPEEKAHLLSWLHDEKRVLPDELTRTVDSFFCKELRKRPIPVAVIQASGLPACTIENLVYNARNLWGL